MASAEACEQAIAAARTVAERIAAANAAMPDAPALRYGIGLHVGDVTYGNIGIPQRLQFTVIGPAANEASRMEGMTKELGEPVIVSATFAEHYRGALVAKGSYALKGVTGLHNSSARAAPDILSEYHERRRLVESGCCDARRAIMRPRLRSTQARRAGDPRAQDNLGVFYETAPASEELCRGGEVVSPRRHAGHARRRTTSA